MRHILLLMLSICVLIQIATIPAHALGIGAYGSFGVDFGIFDYDLKISSRPYVQQFSAGGGIILDTNCAGDRLFNYRLGIGIDRFIINRYKSKFDRTTRFSMNNIFGFGVVRSRFVRFWMGPQLGINYAEKVINNSNGKIIKIISRTDEQGPNGAKLSEYSYYGCNVGLALGLNFNFKENITLTLETGLRYYFLSGVLHYKNYRIILIYPAHVSDIVYDNINKRISRAYPEGYLTVGILYRIDDSFIPAQSIKIQ